MRILKWVTMEKEIEIDVDVKNVIGGLPADAESMQDCLHGLNTIAWCLGKIRDHDKKLKELSRIKAEAAKLERELA